MQGRCFFNVECFEDNYAAKIFMRFQSSKQPKPNIKFQIYFSTKYLSLNGFPGVFVMLAPLLLNKEF